MISTTTLTVPVGNKLIPFLWQRESRTLEQWETVKKLVLADDFHFSCMSDPFSKEVGSYTGEFVFTYYTKDGKLNSVRVGSDGNILQKIQS